MRTITTVLVVLTVLLAGCNTGGTGGTPTATGTADSNESAPTIGNTTVNDLAGVENGAVTNISALLETFNQDGLSGHADLDFSTESSTENESASITVSYRNDTNAQLYEFSDVNQTGKTVTYVHNGTDAERNTTTGEVTYGKVYIPQFPLLYVQALTSQAETLEWETAGTTTVDGELRYVLESNSVNDTAAKNENYSVRSSNTTVDARLTVDSDGIIRSGDFDISSEDMSIQMVFSLDTSESITVSQPDWYDEDEATAAAE
ncbi:DUF7537 family lipoprotein [Haloarcula salinisoli]|uniref:Uncharacterized protein n=1 Tax=Haloarcula salinisoli TaxID=2487746 RepID=A0A8J7YPR7_9EURY|nr:hypothetical protein [Halomicroarcula salinisoli]MBX0287378.1 hypothetical protein [Halomicroarcula salinisoli]MBX0305048.1 hypothetical protein [Halomicroarcula salinisoli]